MTQTFQILFIGWGIVAALMVVLYLRQRRTENATAVDIGWAGGIGFISLLVAIGGEGTDFRRIIVCALGIVWSFLLAGRLYRDRLGGKPEDGRYRNLRRVWGEKAQYRFFWVYQVQAVLSVLFAVPIAVAATLPLGGLRVWDFAAIALWSVAVLSEALADYQLKKFKSKAKNRGRTCREGLWRCSRHPNYFFEWLHWWSYVFLAAGSGYIWLNLIFPLVMLFFILKVSGVPPSERQALQSRGEDYRRYQRTTNAFFPWFPKEENP